MIPGLCRNGKCINIRGGYRCMCNAGYKLTMDAKRCLGKKLLCSLLSGWPSAILSDSVFNSFLSGFI